MSRTARASRGATPRWRTYLVYAVLVVVAYQGLKLYAGYGIATKFAGCVQGEPLKGASAAGMEAIGRRAVECVDGKVNFIERFWFDKDEVLASLTVNGRKPGTQ